MIRVQLFDSKSLQTEIGGAELIEQWLKDPSLKIWVYLQYNSSDEGSRLF